MALNLVERIYIVGSHPVKTHPGEEINPNASEVARQFRIKFGYRVSYVTVINVWRIESLPIGKHGGKRHKSNEEMSGIFNDCSGNGDLAAERYGGSPHNYRNRWVRLKRSGLL